MNPYAVELISVLVNIKPVLVMDKYIFSDIGEIMPQDTTLLEPTDSSIIQMFASEHTKVTNYRISNALRSKLGIHTPYGKYEVGMFHFNEKNNLLVELFYRKIEKYTLQSLRIFSVANKRMYTYPLIGGHGFLLATTFSWELGSLEWDYFNIPTNIPCQNAAQMNYWLTEILH